jgi:hypothetical protein
MPDSSLLNSLRYLITQQGTAEIGPDPESPIPHLIIFTHGSDSRPAAYLYPTNAAAEDAVLAWDWTDRVLEWVEEHQNQPVPPVVLDQITALTLADAADRYHAGCRGYHLHIAPLLAVIAITDAEPLSDLATARASAPEIAHSALDAVLTAVAARRTHIQQTTGQQPAVPPNPALTPA